MGDCRFKSGTGLILGVVVGSGRFEEIERPCGSSRWCPGGQPQMSQNPSDYRGIYNGGDDLQGATAMWTTLDVDIEYPFE